MEVGKPVILMVRGLPWAFEKSRVPSVVSVDEVDISEPDRFLDIDGISN
jgi:hypothetical protein